MNRAERYDVRYPVTLGVGQDSLELRADNFLFDANINVTDFETGRGGDTLRLADCLEKTLTNYDGGDPFDSGHLRLTQDGSSALLQVGTDGGADSWHTIVTFENARTSAFRPANFDDGYDPRLGALIMDHQVPAHPLTDSGVVLC